MKSNSFFLIGGVSLLAATGIIMTQTNCGQTPGTEATAEVPLSDNLKASTETPETTSTTEAVESTGQDWPVWSGNGDGNLFSPEKGIAASFDPGKFKKGTEEVDLSTTTNVKWVAKLGSQAYGNTTVSNGKVYVGTNNESPRDERHIGDRGIVYCLDEKTGELEWQLVVPKLGAGKVSDWEYLGICSSPAVEGNRVYVVANRSEILCLDTEGLKNGNQGFQGEATFMVDKGKEPLEPTEKDADIIWRFDLREELGVFPHT